jgi:hypothetical protein
MTLFMTRIYANANILKLLDNFRHHIDCVQFIVVVNKTSPSHPSAYAIDGKETKEHILNIFINIYFKYINDDQIFISILNIKSKYRIPDKKMVAFINSMNIEIDKLNKIEQEFNCDKLINENITRALLFSCF